MIVYAVVDDAISPDFPLGDSVTRPNGRAARPPDPRAESILAAVFADPVIAETIEIKSRPIAGTADERMTTHALTAEDWAC